MVGDLVVSLIARTDRFTKGINSAQSRMSRFTSGVMSSLKTIATYGGVAAAGIAGIGVASVKLAADAEQTAISFEVMTGSASVAVDMLERLRVMGAKTPFEFNDLATATRVLLNFGRTSEEALSDISMLSDVAAGDANKLQSLALVFGQIAANGRLTGQDLLQLINAGFNPLQQIAARTGETMSELRDRMSAGKVGLSEVQQAFADATSEGGRFFKMNERQSQTILGKWSTLKDGITSAMMDIGKALIENLDLSSMADQLQGMVETFKNDWIPLVEKGIQKLPTLVDAFTEVANVVLTVVEYVEQLNRDIDNLALAAAAVANGVTVQEMFDAREEGRASGLATMKAADRIGNMAEMLAKSGNESVRRAEQKPAALPSADDLASGFSIDLTGVDLETGIQAMTPQDVKDWEAETNSFIKHFDGLMALDKGPFDEPNNLVGSLQAGSEQAFEVLRANVGAGKPEEKQLKESQKTNKLLTDILKETKLKTPVKIEEKGFG